MGGGMRLSMACSDAAEWTIASGGARPTRPHPIGLGAAPTSTTNTAPAHLSPPHLPSLHSASPKMSLDVSVVEQLSSTMAGVVAVDGGTIGLEVNFGAFLAVILGLFIPVVFLVTLFIQSDAQGTATTFRQPDSIGGTRFEDE